MQWINHTVAVAVAVHHRVEIASSHRLEPGGPVQDALRDVKPDLAALIEPRRRQILVEILAGADLPPPHDRAGAFPGLSINGGLPPPGCR
jgi:hypothetical protein